MNLLTSLGNAIGYTPGEGVGGYLRDSLFGKANNPSGQQQLTNPNPSGSPMPGAPSANPVGGMGMGGGIPQGDPNDAMARKMGFRDAATAAAYYQHQQQMRTGPVPPNTAGSWMDRLFSIHPAVMLGHVLDKWNQAEQK